MTIQERLTIPAGCTQAEFIRIVKELAALGRAQDMLVADAAHFALKTWGKEKGLSAMCSATGYKSHSLYKSHFVALAFPPAKRFPCYNFNTYRFMLPFPTPWRDEFLARHVGENLSSRDLRALAVKEFGSEPYKNRRPKKCSVRIRAEIYARVRPFSGSKVAHFIEGLLEEWLKRQPDVPAPVVVTPEPVEEPRPTYAERRQAQLDAGAPPIPAKRKRKPVKLRVAWTECSPEQFVDSENGPVLYKRAHGGPATKFWTEADASEAEQKNFEAKGYRERVARCPVCSGGNARKEVFHVFHTYRT